MSSSSSGPSPRYFYQLCIQYKGTHYLGWQVQARKEEGAKTIQGVLSDVLQEMCHSDKVRIQGSGRTDSGVHALGQIVKIDIPLNLPTQALLKGMNALLPDDIRVRSVNPCSGDFHPIRDAKSKEYRYLFCHAEDSWTPLMKDFIARTPRIGQDFQWDWAKVRAACEMLCGKHNFQNFYCVGTPTSTTIRTLFECELVDLSKESMGHLAPLVGTDCLMFRFVGDGFLKQMVRLLVGTLWNIGVGKVSLEELKEALQGQIPDKQKLGKVAPPEGLYLYQVHYDIDGIR
jgi:tRNA pseudouridine38-40 synthase